MEKANIFVSIRSLDSTQLGCKFDDYDYVLRALRADYPDYTLTDLMMVCKIERLYKRGFIEKDRYDQLIDLYDLRVKTEDKFYEIFGRGLDEEYVLEQRIFDIDSVLSKYGLMPTGFY